VFISIIIYGMNKIKSIDDRTLIAVDMPLHGNSRENIKANWTLNDCAEMLLEILESLQITKVVAIGHSWGSMTILRAAHMHPDRFASIGLCNMPFHAASKKAETYFRPATFYVVVQKLLYKAGSKGFVRQNIIERKSFINKWS
jgi:pimeloyl-ACP methyl ester carboxylesterase